jgi:hypothetical protein
MVCKIFYLYYSEHVEGKDAQYIPAESTQKL